MLLVLFAGGVVIPGLAACGGGNGQVSVEMSYPSGGGAGPYKPGETQQFVVSVVNHGPGNAPGVQVRVDLPGSFRYKSTAKIGGLGNARTQPVDARVGVSDPLWGLWDLAAPNPDAVDPADRLAHVDITFAADVGGAPDTYTLTGHAQGDNTAGIVSSSPLPVQVEPAPKLSVSATVSPTSLKANSVGTYRVTITNSGDGPANNVGVLIALPPAMGFQQTVTPFGGNASRSNPIDPVKNSVEVFYGGFSLPANSSAGPGFLTIVFKATVVSRPAKGTYALSIQLTDDAQDQVYLVDAAPVNVAGISPTPSPTPRASPSPGH